VTFSSPVVDCSLVDGHVDLPYALERMSLPAFAALQDGPVTTETLSGSRVELITCALYCPDRFNGPESAWPQLNRLLNLAQSGLGPLRPLPDVSCLTRPWAGGATSYQLLVENGDGLLEADLDSLQQQGVRMVGLTHAGCNRLADGNGVAKPGGLRPEGRSLLRELERRGWVVDLAHLAEPGFWEVLDGYAGPVMTSHTGLRSFCDRPRNLSREQLRALVERGGVVGLALAPEMLTGDEAGIDDVVGQLEWMLEQIPAEMVAIGSDYCGFDGACRGLEDYRNWRTLGEMLSERGFSEQVVRGILGGNWLNFYRRWLSDNAGAC